MSNKLNLKFNLDFKKYVTKQVITILITAFMFFLLAWSNLGLTTAFIFVWIIIILGMLYIILDLKYYFQIQDMRKDLDNIKYIIDNIKRR